MTLKGQATERPGIQFIRPEKLEDVVAEILALGITHYPPLGWSNQRMASIHKRMLANPALAEAERLPENWPAEMRAQWGNDEGATAAAIHRQDLVGWMSKVRASLDAFKPDFVILFGDDQYENFKEDIVPPYCICAFDEFEFGPYPNNVWGESPETRFKVPGAPGPAKELTAALIEEGFDAAYAYKPLHNPLGHAFANAIMFLDYERKNPFKFPIIPVTINCYGRRVIAQRGGTPKFDEKPLTEADLDPPAPTPRRLFDLGAAMARSLAKSPHRVAVMASSGWSHAFLTAKKKFLAPDTASDRRMYEALVNLDFDAWRNLTGKEVEDAGQQEILNWLPLLGLLSELGQKPTETGLLDTWIFNSSKVFLVAPPVSAK